MDGITINTECSSPTKLEFGSPAEPAVESEVFFERKANSSVKAKSPHSFKSFKASTFEELDANIQSYLNDGLKRLITISCWFDGTFHYAMLSTDSTDTCANANLHLGQTVVNKDGQMMVQCY